MRSKYLLPALCAVGLLSAVGCGSDDDEPEQQYQQPVECKEISEVCHDVDTGEPGPIHDCHELAHDGTAADCSAASASCIPLCEAAAADAGTDGGGDGGH